MNNTTQPTFAVSDAASGAASGANAGDDPATRAVPIERVISVRPFIVRRRIAFRDCDPAGLVYTPRFFDPIATSALELFMMEACGPPDARDDFAEGLGFPAKAFNLVFHKGTRLGDMIDIRVACARVKKTTFAFSVEGRDAGGDLLFDGELTSICVRRDSFAATPVPPELRARLNEYLDERE